MSSPSDAIAYLSGLLDAFEAPASQADDVLIAAALLSFFLLGIISNRSGRQRRAAARQRHVSALIARILSILGPHGATGITAAWWGSTQRLDLEVAFGARTFFLSGFLQLDPAMAAAGILEAYREAVEAGDLEDEADDAEQSAGSQQAPHQATDTASPWWDILGVGHDASRQEIKLAYRSLAMANHPDLGGDVDEMAKINAARDRGMAASG